MGINTYKESSLHHSLKNFYAIQENGKTEIESDGLIYDIVTPENKIIEIQTQNISKLLKKAMTAIEKGRKIKIVYPLVTEKIIETYDEEKNLISRRKSPKKNSIYSIFRELTGIYPVLLNESFTLEIIHITTKEIRIKYNEPKQTENRKRRFKKNWIKTDKKLGEIIKTETFCKKSHYLNLLPENLPTLFTSSDIKKLFKETKHPKDAVYFTPLMLWVFNKMNLIEKTDKKGNTYIYKIKNH